MNRLILGAGLAAAALLSTPANAGFTGPLIVKGLDIGDGNALIIAFEEPFCGPGKYHAHVYTAAANYQSMLALALTAQTTRTPVRIWINSCDGGSAEAVRLVLGSVW
jgi:hypothetical protein